MPKDMTDKYNTKLSSDDEESFADYLSSSGRAGDLADYDLRGWWKKSGKTDDRGHMTDEFKKPNHPTFSTDSKYSGTDGYAGGEWSGSDKDGWRFKASKSNIKNMTPDELQEYFKKVEPDAVLDLPADEAKSKSRMILDHPSSRKDTDE